MYSKIIDAESFAEFHWGQIRDFLEQFILEEVSLCFLNRKNLKTLNDPTPRSLLVEDRQGSSAIAHT